MGANLNTGFLLFRLGSSGNPSLRFGFFSVIQSLIFQFLLQHQSLILGHCIALATSFPTKGAMNFPYCRKSAPPIILLIRTGLSFTRILVTVCELDGESSPKLVGPAASPCQCVELLVIQNKVCCGPPGRLGTGLAVTYCFKTSANNHVGILRLTEFLQRLWFGSKDIATQIHIQFMT